MADGPIRVVALCGSIREGSLTKQALAVALEGAAAGGADTELIDLRGLDIPFCDGGDQETADLGRVREALAGAQGILLGTPEYHGSYSGVLKNALDLMGFDEFRGKIVGLVGVSGGAMGAHNALQSLRTVGRSLHAWVVPTEASVPRAWDVFGDDGRPADPRLSKRLRAVGGEVAQYAALFASRQTERFLEMWQNATDNPGAK